MKRFFYHLTFSNPSSETGRMGFLLWVPVYRESFGEAEVLLQSDVFVESLSEVLESWFGGGQGFGYLEELLIRERGSKVLDESPAGAFRLR